MKRKITALLMLCCLVFSLASCKEEDHTKEARETASRFMETVKSGNFTKATSYCTDEEAQALGWESYSQDATDDFTSSISGDRPDTDRYTPSEAVVSIISSWVDQLCSEMITDYTIRDDITHEKQVYTVPVDISYHNTAYLSTELSEAAQKYVEGDLSKVLTSEKMAELTQIYLKEGKNAMLDNLLETILPDLLKSIEESYKTSGTIDDTITLTVEKIDGDWLISGDDGKLRQITSLNSGSESDKGQNTAEEPAVSTEAPKK